MTASERTFVVGWPIAHSRSPLIHGHWLRAHGIAGSYEKLAVPPDRLATFVEALREGAFRGGNVTIPHKEAAAGLCDRLTPVAQRLASVNTLWMDGEELWGDSTDGAGFLAALDDEAPGWDAGRRSAVVLGAGGAARAVVAALGERGCQVFVANRTLPRARALAETVGGTALPVAALPLAIAEADLLVNATAAGMRDQPGLALDLSALPPTAVVNDLVYVPRDTPLLRAATARGLRGVGGLGMLLHQAKPGFARWYGVVPTVTPALRALVEADISAELGGAMPP